MAAQAAAISSSENWSEVMRSVGDSSFDKPDRDKSSNLFAAFGGSTRRFEAQPFEAQPAGGTAVVHAASHYDISTLKHHVSSVAWLTAGVYASTLTLGVLDWDWGTASFSLADEGFFGRDTDHGGTDKIGHAYSTYLLSISSPSPSGARRPDARKRA